MYRILIIEDNHSLRNNLCELLKQQNYTCYTASTVNEALLMINSYDIFDLYLIDLELPDGNGLSICDKIRSTSLTPIIFITANNSEKTIIEALSRGGDDYIAKPFRIGELLARIGALLRRCQGHTLSHIIKSADLTINLTDKTVCKDGTSLVLRHTEFTLLTHLIEGNNHIVQRQLLLEKIWDSNNNFVDENTLSVHISRLRNNLGTYNDTPYFETIWGVGYRWKHKVYH